MRILWIINWPFPEVSLTLTQKPFLSQVWLLNLATHISSSSDELSIVCLAHGIAGLKVVQIGKIKHYVLPVKKRFQSDAAFIRYFKEIIKIEKPDIVHIFGTEFTHGRTFLQEFPEIPTVLTIQGLITRISQEYYGGLSLSTILFNRTFRENYRLGGMLFIKLKYKKQAKIEQEMIRRVKYVTGRTFWDRSILLSINPNLKYRLCNWNLRSEFYSSQKWRIDEVVRHSIYTCFASIPLKGLHILMRSISLLKSEFPDIVIKVPGIEGDLKGMIVVDSGYKKYLKHLISELKIERNIIFLGAQKVEEVIDEMLGSNIVVIPSAIEGDSLVALEAQYLGVPLICSFRGGMTELLNDGYDGFYFDYSEYAFLANRIKQLFLDDDLCKKFSENGKNKALIKNDPNTNVQAQKEVYFELVKDSRSNNDI